MVLKKMKTIEETFKAEKEILEFFFKNRKINTIKEDGLTFREDEYKIFGYYGKIKNLQELNVKNSFDLLKYLKPVSLVKRLAMVSNIPEPPYAYLFLNPRLATIIFNNRV